MSTKPESIKALAMKVLRRKEGECNRCPTQHVEVGQQLGHSSVCFHCHGGRSCRCIVCGHYATGLKWVAGDCIACRGTGTIRRGMVQ